jgi:hypothetical protein
VSQQKIRLVLAAALFAGWLGYLLVLVVTLPASPNKLPIVLSRPQILVSQVDVVGTLNAKDGTVDVQEVLYPLDAKKPAKGDEIKVTNLDEVRPPLTEQASWGRCLLPLQTSDNGMTYRVVHIPPSPGYTRGDARIYPATDETLAEYREIHKP